MATSSPPSVRMLENLKAVTRPPSIPSHEDMPSQRSEEHEIERAVATGCISEKQHIGTAMESEIRGAASNSAKKNGHITILHAPLAESAVSGDALAEKEQITNQNDELQQIQIDEESEELIHRKNDRSKRGEELQAADEAFENATQSQENGENNTVPDSFDAKIAEITASVPPNGDVVLSLNNHHYKSVMWLHYKELGRNRDSEKEAESADEVFQLFKQHMGTGKFYKLSPFGEKILVDERTAYDKIIADIRRRLVSYKHWSMKIEGGAEKKKSPSAPIIRKKRAAEKPDHLEDSIIAPTSPRRSTRARNAPENQPQQKIMRTNNGSSGPAENDIVLSLNDERYREVMWKHFRLLGAKTPGDNSREEEIGNRLFQWFKTGLRRGGHFYKKEPRGDEIFKVDDELALRKIIRDLKRRMESSHKWYNYDNANAEMEKLLGGSRDTNSGSLGNTHQANFIASSNGTSQLPSMIIQNSLVELLDSSHLGKRLPPINTLATVRAIQTPNELIQTLLLATHKLNELNGTSSKHRKQLRLYELREFSAICGLNFSIHKDLPSLAELAEYMETTPKSLRKWFRMYKKALTRRFDFKRFGNDRIRDHYDVFFGSDYYQFSKDAEVTIERFFQDTAKKIMQDIENGVVGQTLTKSAELETSNSTGGANIFNKPTTQQIGGERASWNMTMRVTNEDTDQRPISSYGETVFQRHFQRNQSRLQFVPNCPFRLCPKVKRIEKGQKIRTICMIDGCEKQAQTKCDGCCTAHFRMISSVPYEKNFGFESVTVEATKYAVEERKETSPCPLSDVGSKKVHDVEEMDVDRLISGSRIYVEWSGDDTLYKATVKKVFLDRNEPTVKIHYDGKKRHILDTVSLDMVKGFIAGENGNTEAAAKLHVNTAPARDVQIDSGDIPSSDIDHTKKKARHSPPNDDDDAEVAYINFNNAASESNLPPQSPMARFSPISRNRDRARSIVLISPISTKPITGCPTETHPQQLPTSAFVGIRSAQKSTVPMSRASSNGVSDSAQELFAQEPELPEVEANVEKPQSQAQLQQPESENAFKCPECSADCMYDSRMCSVCFMKSYYISGQASVGCQMRDVSFGQRKNPGRDVVNQDRTQESITKQKPLQSKPVVCHCPDCEKGDFTIQGMYAHWGRAHNVGKLPWNRVTYSCPFCNLQRKFNSLGAIESHTNSAHPRCELLTPNAPKQSRSSNVVAAPSNDRSLRDRKALVQTSAPSSDETSAAYKPAPPEPLKFKKLEYAHLLPDGRKEYPRDLSKVIEMIEEQCKEQEESVNTALDQRSKLCKSEAANDAKELKEERLAYQRGIRERTRMADQERIEKHRYNERHAELTMLYEYENRNKTRDREEVQLNRLCSNPIMIASGKMRYGPQSGAVCDDEECQFCREDSIYREHLLLDNEVPEFKLDFATDEALDLQQKVKVLNPSVRAVIDSDFSIDAASDSETAITSTDGRKQLNNSRRAASTNNRLRSEEDKLLDLKYTKHNLEFINKYNQGLIRNAWGEKKETRGRKL